MNPDQNQNQPQYSIDYLNQIAPASKKPGMDNKKFLLLAGGGILLAIIVGFLVLVSSSASGPKEKMETLAARMQTLKKIADTAQKNIKSSELRSTNSSLTIFLTNANRDVAAPLAANGVDVKKENKKITAAENGAKLTAKLEDARLNAVFDRTYAREMGYQLETVTVLMRDIYKNTKSKSLKEFLENTNANLQPITKKMENFNATNG